ncbi:hypothetical protein ACFLXY_07275 [Chloroflexota bacterium]
MKKTGVYYYTTRIVIALAVMVATVLGSLPVTVQAAPDPIDLELDAAGYTPIIVNNIKPGDSGVKTVELRNVGAKDGLVYIWLSDIIESEGLNPDSETGDTSGDGELGEYFSLDIDVEGLSTNLELPAAVENFPTSVLDQKYIKVIALKVGETRILNWYWELPHETGNMVQGDELSFTINYHLREIEDTGGSGGVPGTGEFPDNTPVIDEKEEEKEYKTLEVNLLDEKSAVEISEDGVLKESVILTDPEGMFRLEIPGGTRITGTGGIPPSRIELTIEEISILLPDNTVLITPIYRLIGYDTEGNIVHIEFDPPVRLTIRYDPENIPENSFPPYVAGYSDEEGLVPLESPVKLPVSLGRIDALVDSGYLFMGLVEVAPPPPPLPVFFTATNLIVTPRETREGNPVTISVTISNEGLEHGTYEMYLIVDGIVRAIQKVALSGKSSETLTFEITNLAAGVHQIKVAGLTETVRIEQVAIEQLGPGVNWMVLDLGVAGVVIVGLLLWSLYLQRAHRRETEIGI